MINPKYDGIDHINIYSAGKTELGKFLSNFTRAPIITKDGKFTSIEGYWYWLSSNDNKLRELSGFAAKKYGREIGAKDWLEGEEFEIKIKAAILNKIETYNYTENVVFCDLPFKHYYNFHGKIIEPKEGQWLIDFFNSLRIIN